MPASSFHGPAKRVRVARLFVYPNFGEACGNVLSDSEAASPLLASAKRTQAKSQESLPRARLVSHGNGDDVMSS